MSSSRCFFCGARLITAANRASRLSLIRATPASIQQASSSVPCRWNGNWTGSQFDKLLHKFHKPGWSVIMSAKCKFNVLQTTPPPPPLFRVSLASHTSRLLLWVDGLSRQLFCMQSMWVCLQQIVQYVSIYVLYFIHLKRVSLSIYYWDVHVLGQNHLSEGYIVTPKTLELLSKHLKETGGKVCF